MLESCELQLTVLAQPVVSVTKSGNKLGLHIPNLSATNETSRVLRITIESDSGTSSFLARASEWVCIPSRIRHTLGIKNGQEVQVVELKAIPPHSPRPIAIVGNKVDMLSLIPATTSRGYRLYVDSYEDQDPRLRVWYYHSRGAARQIELKRNVDVSVLGGLLGQLQAEGDKKSLRVVFKNSAISEHADFISALRELCPSTTNIESRCIFNPNKATPRIVRKYSAAYKGATGISISSLNAAATMKGSIVAETFVRSAVLATILASAMDETRRGSIGNRTLREAFLAKLLSGDGTLDSRKRSGRLDVRLKIVDQNQTYLQDYAAILKEEGFRAKVIPEDISVRAYCTWLNLVTLYRIGAFKNSRNWVKLLCSMKIALMGRETRGYKRIQEFANLKAVTSYDVCARYGVGSRSANLWLVNMTRLGLIERSTTAQPDRYIRYVLTHNGRTISGLLDAMEHDYYKISRENKCNDAERLLEKIKVRKRVSPSSTE